MKPLTRPDAEEDIRLTLNDYKKLLGHDVPTALPDTVAALLDLLDRYCEGARIEARIDELSCVQLDYGHYVAQTFVGEYPMSITARIAELEAALKPKSEGSDHAA